RPGADRGYGAGCDGREGPAAAGEALAREPERGGEHHPVDVAARARLGAVEVAVRVEPDDAAEALGTTEPAERPERDRVVAAEDERDRAVMGRLGNEFGDVAAGLPGLGEEPRMLVPGVDRFRHGGADVPTVVHLVSEPLDSVVQAGVADRGRAHVHASAPGAQVESGADDCDFWKWLHR